MVERCLKNGNTQFAQKTFRLDYSNASGEHISYYIYSCKHFFRFFQIHSQNVQHVSMYFPHSIFFFFCFVYARILDHSIKSIPTLTVERVFFIRFIFSFFLSFTFFIFFFVVCRPIPEYNSFFFLTSIETLLERKKKMIMKCVNGEKDKAKRKKKGKKEMRKLSIWMSMNFFFFYFISMQKLINKIISLLFLSFFLHSEVFVVAFLSSICGLQYIHKPLTKTLYYFSITHMHTIYI